ncbi:MAG: LiaF transmembrane domain-containing protein [Blastococcus sp.]
MSPLRVWLAGVLITLGVLWLLDAANVLDAGSTIDHWWPVAVMALAVCAAVAERRISLGPTVLFVIGTLMLVNQLDVAKVDAVVWPVIAILAGIWLLANRTGWGRAREQGSDRPDVVAVLGGAETSARSQHFRHANVSAVFGGATLDMREAHLDPGASVDALALFGGVDVIVPKGWRVDLGGLPIFGGYEDKTTGNGDLPSDAPVLRVAATAIFGGVDVKNKRD